MKCPWLLLKTSEVSFSRAPRHCCQIGTFSVQNTFAAFHIGRIPRHPAYDQVPHCPNAASRPCILIPISNSCTWPQLDHINDAEMPQMPHNLYQRKPNLSNICFGVAVKTAFGLSFFANAGLLFFKSLFWKGINVSDSPISVCCICINLSVYICVFVFDSSDGSGEGRSQLVCPHGTAAGSTRPTQSQSRRGAINHLPSTYTYKYQRQYST